MISKTKESLIFFEIKFYFADGSNLLFSPKGSPITVGRDPSCEVTIPLEGVSRKHLMLIIKSETDIMVKDLGSKNGTFVNDKMVPSNSSVPIRPGDNISFGPVKKTLFRFENQKFSNVDTSSLRGESVGIASDEKTVAIKLPLKELKEAQQAKAAKTEVEPKLELNTKPVQGSSPKPAVKAAAPKAQKAPKPPKAKSKKPLLILAVLLICAVVAFLFNK